jgi:hypothetical protein
VVIAAAASARAGRAEIRVQGISPLVKIQPDSPPPYPLVGAPSNSNPDIVPLSAARNEFEAFQLVIYNANADMRGIDFGTSGLTGPNGATIPVGNIRFYREAYVNNLPTNFEALLNDVPDPLIPKVDEGYAGGQPQTRSAFFHFSARSSAEEAGCAAPTSDCNRIPPSQNRVIWVDIYVPPLQPDGTQTPAGLYTGSVDTYYNNGLGHWLTVNLTVLDFDLDSTSSLPSRFDMSGNSICAAHFPSAACDEPRMRRMYARMLLDHRISSAALMVGGFSDPTIPNFTETSQPWDAWKKYYTSLVEGSDSAELPALLKGSQLTTINYAWGHPDVLDGAQSTIDANRHQIWKNNLGSVIPRTSPQKTWFSRTLDYICDEPSRPSSDCGWRKTGQVDASGNLRCALTGDPATILTRRAQNASGFWTFTASSIDDVSCHDPGSYTSDVFAIGPVLNQMDNKALNENGVAPPNAGYQRGKYDAFRETWWYQSCDLQGCNRNPFNGAANPTYYDNWPSYRVDGPTMHQHRAQEWLSYIYRIAGEFYWDTVSQLPTAWGTQAADAANGIGGTGDGNLLYPGTPTSVFASQCNPADHTTCKSVALGGPAGSDIPIASLRLKMIREGMEDYEYLKMAEALDPAATPDGKRLFARQYSEPLFDPNAVLGSSAAAYHSYNSGKGSGMLAVRGAGQDLMAARKALSDRIQQLAGTHSVATTLVSNNTGYSTYRVDSSSNPNSAPLNMSSPWSAVQLSSSNITAGTPVTGTVNSVCPAPQLSSFTVTTTRAVTQQKRTALAYLPQSFSVSPSWASATVPPGSNVSYVINTASAGSSPTPQKISSFSVPSLQPGVTLTSFSPASLAAGQSTTMLLNVSSSTPNGTYSINVNANGCETKSTAVTLVACTPYCPRCGVSDGCGGTCPDCPPPPLCPTCVTP